MINYNIRNIILIKCAFIIWKTKINNIHDMLNNLFIATENGSLKTKVHDTCCDYSSYEGFNYRDTNDYSLIRRYKCRLCGTCRKYMMFWYASIFFKIL